MTFASTPAGTQKIVFKHHVELLGWPEKVPFTCPGKLKANQVFAVIHAINRGTVNFRSLTEEDVRHTSEQDAVREGALRAKDPEAFGKKKRKRQTDNDAGGDDDDVEKDEPGRCKKPKPKTTEYVPEGYDV